MECLCLKREGERRRYGECEENQRGLYQYSQTRQVLNWRATMSGGNAGEGYERMSLWVQFGIDLPAS